MEFRKLKNGCTEFLLVNNCLVTYTYFRLCNFKILILIKIIKKTFLPLFFHIFFKIFKSD